MPGRDRRGPTGMGAMTGHAAGYCGGSGVPVDATSVRGGGVGMGFGRGRGDCGRGSGSGGRRRRNMFHATGLPRWMRSGGNAAPYGYPAPYQKPDPEMEKQVLRHQAETLQSGLDFIKKRMGEIETITTAK